MADKVDSSVQTDPVIITSCRKRVIEKEDVSVVSKKQISKF